MAYADILRDRVMLQQSVQAADGYGGQDETWTDVLSVPARVTQMSSHRLQTYGRTGAEHGLTVFLGDAIPRTDSQTSIYALLTAPDETAFRFVYNTRTLTIIGVHKRSQGVHDTMAGSMFVDTVEAPERIGRMDA